MARKKGSADYPVEMKREAIRLYHEEKWSSSEIVEYFKIRDPQRVRHWLWRYGKEGERMFANLRSRSGRKPKKENTAAIIARLKMELDLLKKFHTELRQDSLVKRDIGLSKTTEETTK